MNNSKTGYKNKQNNSFWLLLTFLGLTTWPVFISAHDFEVDGIYYNFNVDGISVSVTYKGKATYNADYSVDVVIPSEVSYNGKNYSVTSIGERAFSNCERLTSVTIPNSVTSIGLYAFKYCI